MNDPFEGRPSSRPTFRDRVEHEFYRDVPNGMAMARVFAVSLTIIALLCCGIMALALTFGVIAWLWGVAI